MRLQGRIALVTGASRGIGAAVARRYAVEGAQVILAARTLAGLEEVDDAIQSEARAAGRGAVPATIVKLDVGKGDEIDRMALSIAQRFGRLDVLVGNAGMYGPQMPTAQIPPADWERTVDVNLNANWRLMHACEPLLRASDSGRAIFVTSGIVRNASRSAYKAPYAVTKAALETLVRIWATELEKTPIRVNLLNPGGVRTEMHAEAYPGLDPMGFPPPEAVTEPFVALAEASCTLHGETVHAQPNIRPPTQR
jgi:NAD(P)-dependent dehydrogenase (short-subunit alcohol dehydrogenase family)